MHPFSCIFAFLLAHAAASQIPHFNLQQTDSPPLPEHGTVKTCDRMRVLEKLTNAPNSNKLNFDVMIAQDDLSQEEINYILSDAGPLASELRNLKANTTLTAQCGVIFAHKDAVNQCVKLDKLEKLAELATNKTAYNEHLAGEILNTKQVDQLRKNMEAAEVKLQKLRTNTTLITLCNTEPGLRSQASTVAQMQQAGSIGSAAVDNSGAISPSTSRASILQGMWLSPCALAMGLSMGFALL